MTISDRTRKLLWARAHNACAICDKPLTEVARSPEMSGLVLGEEAHIVARRIDGPRGRDGDRSDIDAYDNLILLCADDHIRVDAQPDVSTVDILRDIKKTHEARAPTGGRKWEPIRVHLAANEDAVPYSVLVTGQSVWNLMAGAGVYHLRSVDNDERPDATDAADAFLTNARDWAEIADTVQDHGLRAVRDAQRSLQDDLVELWEHDLFAYGRRLERTISGGLTPPAPFIVAELAVLTADEVREQIADRSADL